MLRATSRPDPDAARRLRADETLGLLHRSDELTIQHGIFAGGYATGIHDHTVRP